MARVSLEFVGNARSAVAASRETQESLQKTGRAATGYSAEVAVAKKETEGLTRGMLAGAEVSGELRRALLLGSTAFIGGFGFVSAIKTATEAAIEHEASQKQLIAAVKAAGLSYGDERDSIEKTLKSQRDLAGFSEDDTVKAYTAAVRATRDVSEANRLSSIAADLARGRNMDLVSATQLVIKVNGGQLGAVRRLLPFIDKHATATEALATIQQRYAGSAEAFSKTAAGAQARLSNAIKETEIAIGQALLPTITRYEGELAGWLSKTENQKKIQHDVNQAMHAAGDVLDVVIPIVRTAAKVADTFSHAVGGGANALKLLTGAAIAWKITGAAAAATGMREVGLAAGEAGAAGKVGLLLSRLRTLRAIAATGIVLGIEIDIIRKIAPDALRPLSKAGDLIPVFRNGKWVDPNTGVPVPDQAYWNKQLGTGTPTQGGTAYGGHGTALNPTVTGPGATRQQASLVSTARTSLGNPYQYGGAPSLSKPTDCSGLMVAVFAKNGISLPRTSQQQYAQAPIKNRLPLLAGDLVFSEGVHPGHVGLYIGNDQVLEDPHTGDHVKIVALSAFGWNGESARWWGGKASTGGGGGATTVNPYSKSAVKGTLDRLDAKEVKARALTPKDQSDDLAILVSERDFLKQAVTHTNASKEEWQKLADLNDQIASIQASMKKPGAKTPTGTSLLSGKAREAIAAAAGTKNIGDDIAALKAARLELEQLQQTASKKEQVPISEELGRINKQINALETKKARDELAKHKKAYQELAAEAKKVLAQQTAAWKNHVAQLRQLAEEAKQKFESTWGDAANAVVDAFDKATDAGIAAMEKLRVQLTPAEQALSQLQTQHEQSQRDQALAAAQSDLAAAQAAGDPQAVADAQKALDAAQYDQQLADLQAQADAERSARDEQYQDQEQAYKDQRDQQRTALQQWLDDQLAALESGTEQWATFFSTLQKMAADGGWNVGQAFWSAWSDAQQQLGISTTVGGQANQAATATPEQIYGKSLGYLLRSGTGFGGALDKTPGFASGGWAGSRPTRIDPRDTILARLRPGEYVMSPEEVAAGGPRWARGGASVTVSLAGANFYGAPTQQALDGWARGIAAALERLGPGMALPAQ